MVEYVKENRISIFVWMLGKHSNTQEIFDKISLAIDRENMNTFLSLYSLLFKGRNIAWVYELKKYDDIMNRESLNEKKYFFEQLIIQESQSANSLIEVNKNQNAITISLTESDFTKLFVKFYAGFYIDSIGLEYKMNFSILDVNTECKNEGELIIWRMVNGNLIDLSA